MNKFYNYFYFLVVFGFISACNNSGSELDALRNEINDLKKKNGSKNHVPNSSDLDEINLALSLLNQVEGENYRALQGTQNSSNNVSSEFKLYKPGEFKRNSSAEIVGLKKEEEGTLEEIIFFLSDPEGYKKFGAKPPRGLILYGPPGTGKTEFARIVADKVQQKITDKSREVFFIVASGAEFQDKYVGEAAKKVKRLFEFARNLKKQVIIFIDEFDALAAKRNDEVSRNEQMVNQLLTELDGFDSELNSKIFIIAATNLLEHIDKAVIRPGRIDIKIEVGLPDEGARNALIEQFLNEKPKILNIDVKELVNLTKNWSIAEIKKLIELARGSAAVKKKNKVEIIDFHNAIPRINPGSRIPDDKGRKELFQEIFDEKSIDVGIDDLTQKTKDWTVAKIKDLVKKTIVHAIGKGKTKVEIDDFDAVIKKIK